MITDDPVQRRNLLTGLLALGIAPFLVNGWINSYIYDIPWMYWGFELFSWLLIPSVVFFLAAKKAGLRREEVGLTMTIRGKRSIARVLLTAVLLCPFAWLFFLRTRAFAVSLVPDPGFFSYVQVLMQEGAPRTLIAIWFALSAGIVEELYFRGLMFRICQYYARPRLLFLLASPALFALVHWEAGVDDMLYTGLCGLLFALLYIRWRNLWPLIAAHVFIDYLNFG
jgi:membrane protease YdiL (CAAX protease family)